MSLGQNLKDEYDPARPNDYEQVRKERERLRREAEAEAERQERLRELKELEEMEMQRQVCRSRRTRGFAQLHISVCSQGAQGWSPRISTLLSVPWHLNVVGTL